MTAQSPKLQTLHGTALYMDGCGFILLGPSGIGKSDLALRLIFEGRACLVADDICEIRQSVNGPIVCGPKEGARLLEVRGYGLVQLGHDQWVRKAPLTFALRLMPHSEIPREPVCETLDPHTAPVYPLDPFQASAMAKIRLLTGRHREETQFLWPHSPLPLVS